MALILTRKLDESVIIDNRIQVRVSLIDKQRDTVEFTVRDYADDSSVMATIGPGEHLLVLGSLRVRPRVVSRKQVRLAFESDTEEKLPVLRSELLTDDQWFNLKMV